MNENLFEIYLKWAFITIPLTIAISYVIYKFICKLLEVTINKNKVDKLYSEIDSISLNELVEVVNEYKQKSNELDPWTLEHLRIISQIKVLQKDLNREYRVRRRKEIMSKLNELKVSLKKYDEIYWNSIFDDRLSSKQVEIEMKLREIFTPN